MTVTYDRNVMEILVFHAESSIRLVLEWSINCLLLVLLTRRGDKLPNGDTGK
jgi:hypothetical protein